MKFSMKAGELQTILEDLTNIALTKIGQRQIMNHIKIDVRDDVIFLIATNMEMSMIAEIKVKSSRLGLCTVPAKSFADLISTFPADKKVTISMTDDSRIRVTQSRSRFNLTGANPHQFPDVYMPKDGYMPFDSKGFSEALKKVSPSMAEKKAVRPNLSVILMEPAETDGFMRAIASDGFTLTTYKIPGVLKESFVISDDSVDVLKKILKKVDEVGLIVDLAKHSLYLNMKQGFLSIKLPQNKFPKYKSLLPRGSYLNVILNREDILTLMKRMLLFSESNFGTVDLSICSKEKTVTFTSRSPNGNAEDIIPAEPSSEITKDMKIRFGGKMFSRSFTNFTGKTISLRLYGEHIAAVLLDGTNMMGILMPLRG